MIWPFHAFFPSVDMRLKDDREFLKMSRRKSLLAVALVGKKTGCCGGRYPAAICTAYVTVGLSFILLMWRIRRAPNSIPIYSYIQTDVTSRNLFISGKCSTCFGWYFHTSSGAHTTVSTASGICHTVTSF
jgi:hypothetical protein